jgi:hypothetical protein
MYAIDVINALHAEAVILTPKLKEQMLKGAHRANCCNQATVLVILAIDHSPHATRF